MTTKIEWRLRAVMRYQLTRYEAVIDDPTPLSSAVHVTPAGEFAELNLAIRIGEAMASRDRYDQVDPPRIVTFDTIHLPAPKLRAKMRCVSAWPTRDSDGKQNGAGAVWLTAVYESGAEDGGNAAIENRIFSRATPNATVQMQIENPEAFGRFRPGQDYYVDFIPVPGEIDMPLIEEA